jgi:hypothetical protein
MVNVGMANSSSLEEHSLHIPFDLLPQSGHLAMITDKTMKHINVVIMRKEYFQSVLLGVKSIFSLSYGCTKLSGGQKICYKRLEKNCMEGF